MICGHVSIGPNFFFCPRPCCCKTGGVRRAVALDNVAVKDPLRDSGPCPGLIPWVPDAWPGAGPPPPRCPAGPCPGTWCGRDLVPDTVSTPTACPGRRASGLAAWPPAWPRARILIERPKTRLAGRGIFGMSASWARSRRRRPMLYAGGVATPAGGNAIRPKLPGVAGREGGGDIGVAVVLAPCFHPRATPRPPRRHAPPRPLTPNYVKSPAHT